MTAPHQVAPDGSYVIGGGTYKFGQRYTEDMVRNIVMSGLRGLTISNISEATTVVEGLLRRVPLDALRMARPFIFGATDADFATVDLAVDTIMKSLKIREIFATLGQVQTLLDDLVKAIVKIFTGHENGLDALEQWWDQISGLLGLLGNPDQLVATIQDLLNRVWGFLTGTINHPDKTLKDVVDVLENWVTNTFGAVKAGLDNLVTNFGKLIDAIISLFGGSGSTVTDAINTLRTWLTTVFGGVQSAVTTVVRTVQDLIDGLFKLFGGTGVGHTLTEALTQIGAWLTGPFKLVQDGVASAVKLVQDIIDGLFKLFGGGAGVGKTVAQMIAQIQAWLSGPFKLVQDGVAGAVKLIQDLLDGLFGLFGGAAGVGKTVAQVVAQIQAWLSGPFKLVQDTLKALVDGLGGHIGATVAEAVAFITALVAKVQDIIDGITKIWLPGAGTNNPLQSALDAIAGILGIANSANNTASQAYAKVEAIVAGQAGGFFDEFEVPASANMPAEWRKGRNGTSAVPPADSYGPDGQGSITGRMSGTGLGPVWYIQTTKPLTTPDMRCTVVLSRLPWWNDGILGLGAVKSSWYIAVQASSGNDECYRVKISNTQAQFEKVDVSGNATNLGAAMTIPANATGIPYALEIKGGTLTLYRNHIAVASRAGNTNLSGRCIGFGGEKVPYTNVSDNPLAHFAGIAWQPAV